ncbi:hypothetical protein Hanom_Chr05g00404341 [Helianthus anomalus]
MMFVRIHKTPSRSPSPVVAAAAQSVAEPVKPDLGLSFCMIFLILFDFWIFMWFDVPSGVMVFGWFKSSSSVPCPCVVDFFGIFFISF